MTFLLFQAAALQRATFICCCTKKQNSRVHTQKTVKEGNQNNLWYFPVCAIAHWKFQIVFCVVWSLEKIIVRFASSTLRCLNASLNGFHILQNHCCRTHFSSTQQSSSQRDVACAQSKKENGRGNHEAYNFFNYFPLHNQREALKILHLSLMFHSISTMQ